MSLLVGAPHSLLLGNLKQFPRVCSFYHSKQGVYGYNALAVRRQQADQESAAPAVYSDHEVANRIEHANVVRLVEAYRTHGHKQASLDPLGLSQPRHVPELNVDQFGISKITGEVPTAGILSGAESKVTIPNLIKKLDNLYCKSLAAEFQHLPSEEERVWFAEKFETRNSMAISASRKVELAKLMLRCQAFDNFVGTKFASVKRYGGEGGESMMACFDEIFRNCALHDVKNLVMCMPHRGRLNFMTCLLNFPPVIMFRKMKGLTELPNGARGIGDVLSHLYTSTDIEREGKSIHVSLIPNPSHLEANNPVAMGKVRSKLQTSRSGDYSISPDAKPGDGVLCLQVHGDASFVGQGIVAEAFCFADISHFEVGGSIHLIVNNQVGFTTDAHRARSSQYCSDLAKVSGYPVLHVNADYLEDVVQATSIAMEYRERFRRDVIIDLLCFRRRGHNEMDEPSFTQPLMYKVIKNRQSIPDQYAESVVSTGLCDDKNLQANVKQWTDELTNDLNNIDSHIVQPFHLGGQWSSLSQASDHITYWDTGVDANTLKYIGVKSVAVPDDFIVHQTLQRSHIDRRISRITEGSNLDWATAEALAMGSLLHQGYNVRLSGQDVGRGTFSHRHCMLVDQETDHIHVPLNSLSDEQQAFLEVANSALSEEGVMGFEYGMSIDDPSTLVIWEAQFGDFFNGAQTIIDTYVSCGELKWLLQSAMVMLLPHGMDGAGPDHSSCRMERFLQQCDSKEDKVDGDDVNMQIVFPSTPAQYFHILRRQMVRNFRKPLVVVAPKIILRLPAASSSLSEMLPGTHFHPVLDDPTASVTAPKVKRILFCTGKHYYNLVEEREARAARDVAIVRLESLCPFPVAELQEVMKKYNNATEFIWTQEEHRNMGAWSFVMPRFQNLVGCQLTYAGRDVLGVPAVGIGALHKQETLDLINQAFS